jgi:hypothetical protein
MEHQRQRMLSNLIGAYIADDMPYLPLHPNGEQYPPMAQYLTQMNYYGTTIEVVDSEAVPVQRTADIADVADDIPGEQVIHHWRGNGQEIDPPRAELSSSDAQAFLTSQELGPERNQIADAIRQLCGTDATHITAFAEQISAGLHPDQNLSSALIDTVLCMLTRLRRKQPAIVRTTFSSAYYSTRASRSHLRASDHIYGDPSKADIILILIHKDCPAVNANADNNTGPFCIGVYIPQSGTLFHIDPNGENANGEDKNIYRHAVHTLRP